MSDAIPFVDLRPQHEAIAPDLDQAIARVRASSWYVLGVEGEAFEHEFASRVGARHAIGVNSGTDALHLALLGLGIGPGDEVIVPSHTFIATALAVSWTGATIVFADIDPHTYTLDASSVYAAMSAATKAVVPVHLYGQPADMGPLLDLADDRAVHIVEDAAQAHGATYGGHPVGALGTVGCFSFYPTKNLGALGDAGALVTNDDELADRLRRLRNYGETAKYRHETIGFNTRIDEVQAAVLRAKLPHLEGWNDTRRTLAEMYARALPSSVEPPTEAADRRHVYHLFVVELENRDEGAAQLAAAGVGTQVHYPIPVHRQPVVHSMPHRSVDLPVTERVAERVISLPMYPGLSLGAIERIAAALAP